MIKISRALAVLGLVCAVGTTNAALVGRDINGNAVAGNAASSVFLYDTVLNVTWLRNANAGAGSAYDDTGYGGSTTTDGKMSWGNAQAWAANLTVGSYGGWRLPTMIDTGAAGCDLAYVGTDCNYNVQTKSGNKTQFQAGQTVYSEMASLFYDTLGNKGQFNTSGALQSGYGLANTGDFQNLRSDSYWSGLEYAPDTGYAWNFSTRYGGQYTGNKPGSLYALAVRDGDVLATPIPATAWLMLSGIGVLGAAARRRRCSAVRP
jgi:hypothetical protein